MNHPMLMRKFWIMAWQHLTVALMSVSLITATACTTAQKLTVVTDIQKFLPAVTNVADAVCAFSPAASICTGAVTSVTDSAAILDQALVNYYTAEANGAVPPGIIATLQEAISTFEANAASILDSVHVLNPNLQAEVEAIAAAATVLLAVVESLLPSTVSATKFSAAAVGGKPYSSFNLSNWVTDYNVKVTACQQWLPRNVTLKKIHVHALFLRVITAGYLK